MKKLLFIILIVPLVSKAQSWYPIGATWYYNDQEMQTFPAHGYTKYVVVKDTVVLAKPSKLISREVIRYNGIILSTDTLIVSEDSSKVYYYNNNAFQLMYDFNLIVGDTLNINIQSSAFCDSISPLIVDSIRNVNINGELLKIQYVSGIFYYSVIVGMPPDTITYPIIEKIGVDALCMSCSNFIFNPICNEEQFVWTGLRCYHDKDISYTGCYWMSHFTGAPCDTLINGPTNLPFSYENQNVELFPNPSSDNVNINNVSDFSKIEIYDSCGKLLNEYTNPSKKININIKSYPQGLYFIILKGDHILPKYFKIIKN
jgi:hypothetical protein